MSDRFDLIFIFAVGFLIGMLFVAGSLFLIGSPSIDITTNIISTGVDMQGRPVLNTEVGDFIFGGESTSVSTDHLIVQSIPKHEPVILHIKDGYVISYTKVNPFVKDVEVCKK